MFHCPLCQHAAHARTSRYMTDTTKERYHQCQNVNCSATFITFESVQRALLPEYQKKSYYVGLAGRKAGRGQLIHGGGTGTGISLMVMTLAISIGFNRG